MTNIGLDKIMHLGVDNFTTDSGLKIRRFINPVFRKLLRLGTKRKIICEQFPILKKEQPYIFACSHSFDDDVISSLCVIDRNAYTLCGTSEQILHNPKMYANWVNGIIFVDRLNPQSRKDSIRKMKRVIESGSSVLMYPEGGWNNTENLLIQPLFAGPYTLSQETSALVVPLATFHEHGASNIYVRATEPISFDGMTKEESLTTLRDKLATMVWEMIELHSTPLNRDDLRNRDFRSDFMEERKQEYLRVPWTKDVWEEELAFKHDKNHPLPVDAWAFLDNVKITKQNAHIFAPLLDMRAEHKKYDFKQYMHDHWNK